MLGPLSQDYSTLIFMDYAIVSVVLLKLCVLTKLLVAMAS